MQSPALEKNSEKFINKNKAQLKISIKFTMKLYENFEEMSN